jgi:hypothetical protein
MVLVAAATILALSVLAPGAVSAHSRDNFHLDKTCGPDASEPLGYVCIIQHSDFKWFPAGTKVHYTSQNAAGDVVQATIKIKNGSTSGQCVWSGPVNAICTFNKGTGRLSQFHLKVDVTANAEVTVWYWDGTYWFGHHHHHHHHHGHH